MLKRCEWYSLLPGILKVKSPQVPPLFKYPDTEDAECKYEKREISPNITLFGIDMKRTLHHPITTAVTDQMLTNFKSSFLG